MPSGIFTLKQQTLAVQEAAWPGTKTPAVDYLVVAGGGGGGGSNIAGGGGAGGLLIGATNVVAGSAITVTVGAGGTGGPGGGVSSGIGTNGSNSVFGSISAVGGGYGGGYSAAGNGGSGGGGGQGYVGNQGTAYQGNQGGTGSFSNTNGGGGAGGAGSRGGDGGNGSDTFGGYGGSGFASDISGVRTAYAGGGGGGQRMQTVANGGTGGGGGSSNSPGSAAATANTGGGGGGASGDGSGTAGGAGGSGIVIISYPDTYAAATSTTGSPTVSTSGSGSISFNGSNQYLLYNAQSGFAFGTGDFTIEFFVRFVDVNNGFPIDFRPSGGSSDAPVIYISSTTLRYYVATDRITSGTLTTGVWYHVAVARSGTSTKMFIDGTQVGSTFTDTTNYTVGSSRPAIGSNGASLVSGLLNGYLSNFRIVKGSALYTSNFTAPTAPLTAVTNTTFLLNAISGSVTADSSGNGIAPGTGSASVGWNQLSPFATGLGYKNRVYTWTSSGSITF